MPSVLNVDTLTDAAGTGPVTLTKQSAAKAWANSNLTGTQSNRDSFNIASITDAGTGVANYGISNNMSDGNYSGVAQEGSTNTTAFSLQFPYNSTNTSSQYGVVTFTASFSATADASVVSTAIHGDLA